MSIVIKTVMLVFVSLLVKEWLWKENNNNISTTLYNDTQSHQINMTTDNFNFVFWILNSKGEPMTYNDEMKKHITIKVV